MQFKIRNFKRIEFDSELQNILNESNISANQFAYYYDGDLCTVEIQDSVANQMSEEQLSRLLNIK